MGDIVGPYGRGWVAIRKPNPTGEGEDIAEVETDVAKVTQLLVRRAHLSEGRAADVAKAICGQSLTPSRLRILLPRETDVADSNTIKDVVELVFG